MSEEFGPNFITLTDEDGNDIELEYVDALEDNGQTYYGLLPHGGRRDRRGSRRRFRPGDPEVRDGKTARSC